MLAPPGQYPIQKAMDEAGLAPGASAPGCTADTYMERLGRLPLIHPPGARWLYHTGSDVLGVLIARASGQPFDAFLRERITAPLGMKDTGFHVPPEQIDRLPPSYASDSAGRVAVRDEARGGAFEELRAAVVDEAAAGEAVAGVPQAVVEVSQRRQPDALC